MIEEVKKKIEEKKRDKSSYKKYVQSFCDSSKAKELFSKNDDFNNLKDSLEKKENKKKEDEYF